MAIKFTRSDDLDKMFEEFATLPKIEKIEFPDEKEKKIKNKEKKMRWLRLPLGFFVRLLFCFSFFF